MPTRDKSTSSTIQRGFIFFLLQVLGAPPRARHHERNGNPTTPCSLAFPSIASGRGNQTTSTSQGLLGERTHDNRTEPDHATCLDTHLHCPNQKKKETRTARFLLKVERPPPQKDQRLSWPTTPIAPEGSGAGGCCPRPPPPAAAPRPPGDFPRTLAPPVLAGLVARPPGLLGMAPPPGLFGLARPAAPLLGPPPAPARFACSETRTTAPAWACQGFTREGLRRSPRTSEPWCGARTWLEAPKPSCCPAPARVFQRCRSAP